MVKVNVQKKQLIKTMEKIQNQYNQIMERARESQEQGIEDLCLGWQNPNAKTQIINLVNVLNEKMEKITKRYTILFEKLNGWAGDMVRSGGGHWTNFGFQPRTYNFSAANAKDGDNGENIVFDENLIFNGIGKVQKMAKNIIKNQRDTSAIFARNNECFGIRNDSPKVFDKFQKRMEAFATEIEAEVDQCVKSFNFVSEEQRDKLNMILDKYSTDSVPTYSSDGWTKIKVVDGELENATNGDFNDSGSTGDSSSEASSNTDAAEPVDPDGASFDTEYSE